MDPLRAISIAVDALKGAGDVLDKARVESSVAEIRKALVDAQQSTLDLQRSETESVKCIANLEKTIRDLETKLAKASDWENLSACYSLRETFPASMIFVREFDCVEGSKRGFREPSHWACANCFDQGKRSIMRAKTEGALAVTCPACSQTAQFRRQDHRGWQSEPPEQVF